MDIKTSLLPVVYEHAASFINRSPWEVSRDRDLMAAAHIKAHEFYNHSPITLGMDIYNMEPESYGAAVAEPEGNEVPTITDFPFPDPAELLKLPPMNIGESGRWPLLLKAAKQVRAKLPDRDIRIPLGGPFSIAINLCGFENFLMFSLMNEEKAGEILLHLSENQVDLVKQIKNEGFDVTFFESAATPPMLSPDLFRSLELPSLKYILSQINSIYGKKTALIMGGDTALIAKDIACAGAGFLICPAETDQKLFLENIKGTDINVRINMAVSILASGKRKAIEKEVQRIEKLQQIYGNSSAGTGVLPYDADPSLIKELQNLPRK